MLLSGRLSIQKRIVLVLGLIWILLWIMPWGKFFTIGGDTYLDFVFDLLRLGLAIGLFVVPGALLYIFLQRVDNTASGFLGLIPVGFTLSVLIVDVIGLAGRVMGFSFLLVKILFALFGLIGFIALFLAVPSFAVDGKSLSRSIKGFFSNTPLMLALFLATIMTFNDAMFFIDDTTYLAYMTNWQRSSQLGFYNIIHQVGVIEIERFWLAMYPMGQALLSDLSGVPGILLLSSYLELFLVPMAVITSYWFARTLGVSRRAAGFSVLIQISLYTWMVGEEWPVGTWFYQSMSEDKVSSVFLLAPVFFVFVLRYIKKPAWNNLALVFLSGFCLTLTHPVMLFFACTIAAGLGLFSWIAKKISLYEISKLAIVIVGLMLPYVIIRFYNYSASAGFPSDAGSVGIPFEVDRYINVVSDTFYGLNPGVLFFFDLPVTGNAYDVYQIFRFLPFALTIFAGILAVVNFKNGALYWYVLACVLLVVFATVPYTGWILGYFTDARLISRASWFSPLGLAGVLVLKQVIGWLKLSWASSRWRGLNLFNAQIGMFTGMVICFVFVSPSLLAGSVVRIPYYFDVLSHNRQLAEVGAYIDQTTASPVTVIALDYADIQMLPGVSARTSLISFREEKDDNGHNFFLSPDEIHERIYASNAIRSLRDVTSREERCLLLKKFSVKFVVAPIENASLFADVIDQCVETIDFVYETEDLVLLELK